MVEARVSRWLSGVAHAVAAVLVFGSLYGVTLPAPPAGAAEVINHEEIVKRLRPPRRTRGISTEATGKQRRIALQAIQFEFNSDRFTKLARRQVAELGKALRTKALRPFSFAVVGHTDSVGSAAYNRALSRRRARAVKRALAEEMEIETGRLVEVGAGEDSPIPGLAPDDGRNRRVEVTNMGRLARDGAEGVTRQGIAKKRALIIGIGAYEHLSRLNGPGNDADDMAAFITRHGGFRRSDVRILRDAEATRGKILAAVEEWLVDETSSGDEVFLYYSGHGFQEADVNGDEADRLAETWVPVDAAVTDDGHIKGIITGSEIRRLLDRLRGRKMHVVVDASRARARSVIGDGWRYAKTPRMPDGSRIRINAPRKRGVGRGPVKEPIPISDDPSVVVWSAVKADQTALLDRDAESRRGSVFTRRLLWGARDEKADEDGNGIVTVAELHRYLLKESKAYCMRYADDCTPGLDPQVRAAPGRLDGRAFRRSPRAGLSRSARIAKDILVPKRSGPSSVRLRMEPGTTVGIGKEIEIVVESERNGYLVVLDIDTTGKLVQLFPNEESLRVGVPSTIRAGGVVSLPGKDAGFRFRTVPPLGRGLLIAVVADENQWLTDIAKRHDQLAVVSSPKAYLVEVREALRAVSRGAANASAWDVTGLEYEIVGSDTKQE